MTENHVQGIFGEFLPVLDPAGGTFTQNQIQGVFGYFLPVLDPAQTAEAPAEPSESKFFYFFRP